MGTQGPPRESHAIFSFREFESIFLAFPYDGKVKPNRVEQSLRMDDSPLLLPIELHIATHPSERHPFQI